MRHRSDARPRVAINASYLVRDRYTGIEVYASNVTTRLPAIAPDIDWYLLAPEPVEMNTPNAHWVRAFRRTSAYQMFIETPIIIRRLACDAMFNPTQYVPASFGVPVVSTAFDVAWRYYPTHFPHAKRLAFEWMTRRMCKRAARVLAISDATRVDLIRLYGCDPGRAETTHLGFDVSTFCPTPRADDLQVLDRLRVQHPYLLYVGTLQKRKNVAMLVTAFEMLDTPNLTLVLAGGEGWYVKEILSRIEASPAKKRIVVAGFVPTASLPCLYRHAAAFVYPSLYEGFGIPVVEAMACGAPVVTSDRSSLPEVVGDAAVIVDPTDARSIADGIELSMRDDAWYRRASIDRARLFSWDRCAAETLTAIRSVLGRPE